MPRAPEQVASPLLVAKKAKKRSGNAKIESQVEASESAPMAKVTVALTSAQTTRWWYQKTTKILSHALVGILHPKQLTTWLTCNLVGTHLS